MKKMIIFGAGRYGRTAIEYFKGYQDIAFVVDNSQSLWGSHVMGFEVKAPDTLRDISKDEYFVLIAAKKGEAGIANQLKDYGWSFYATLGNIEPQLKNFLSIPREALRIVAFSCGLGNQMFQYAFYKCLAQRNGGEPRADTARYLFSNSREFLLDTVFPNVVLNKIVPGGFGSEYLSHPLLMEEFRGESLPPAQADMSVLDIKKGYFRGFWQRHQFAKMAEKTLRQDLTFRDKDDRELKALAEKVRMGTTVSVHVRRGDYMSAVCRSIFGGICDAAYYERAVSYIRNHVSSASFLIFTEDSEWVRENLNIPESTIVTGDMFEDYEDWYDMYLMSLCTHNIIANSTFSWWGAWLNSNQNKIVVAPKRWLLNRDILDICPPEWVRL